MQPKRSVYVCYDIANAKRLRRVAHAVQNSGLRVQKSVFECSLNADEWLALRKRIAALVDTDNDSVLYQPICHDCRRRTVWQGLQPKAEHQPYWVI